MLQPDFAAYVKRQCEEWAQNPRIILSAGQGTVGTATVKETIRGLYEDAALDLWKILGEYSEKTIIGNNGTRPKNLFSPMLSKGGSTGFGDKEVFFSATTAGDVTVTLRPSDFDYFFRESLYPSGYPDGAYDIVGLLTTGWTQKKPAFGHWANAGINIMFPPKGQVGVPARPFVRAAIADFEGKYAAWNARVTKCPKTWH